MHRSEIRFSIFAETQHCLGRDYSGRPTSRQTHALTPAGAISVSGAGYIRNAFGQASFAVFQKNNKPMRERCNVASAAGTGQPRGCLSFRAPRSSSDCRNDRPRRHPEIPDGRDRIAASSSRRACPGIALRQGCSADRPWCRSTLAQGWYESRHFQITQLHSEHVFSSRPRMRSAAAACRRRQFPRRGFRGRRSRPSVRPECKDDSRCLISSGCQYGRHRRLCGATLRWTAEGGCPHVVIVEQRSSVL